MGIGDELMIAGEARRRAAGRERKYLILDKHGAPKWHWVWAGNPHVARPGEPHDEVLPGYVDRRRPYLAGADSMRYTFREYRPAPAQIALDLHGRTLASHAAGAVVFNPSVKRGASPNKDWGLENWKALVARGVGLRWLQLWEPGTPRVKGAEAIETATPLEAFAVLSGARAAVVHEGALHHAAAAFGVPAVVVRGGFISPRVTGYAGQVDLYEDSNAWPLGCGKRIPCSHCHAAMKAITPERVLAALRTLLEEKRAA